jgi:ribosomal-protein-alanine N-acetyltransferase
VRPDSLGRRPVAAGDGPALHAVLGHPEVSRWLRPAGVTSPFSPAECDEWAARGAAHWAAHGFGEWVVRHDGEPVARGGLHHTLADGRAEVEVGWAVAPAAWGRGIATAIGHWSLEAAAERGIDGVVAFTRVDNAASRRVMEKLGLRYEREFVHAGLPHVLYRNTRPNR